ncbi:MAG TPA: DUF4321 domain-containing protein [Symbiobacteriaceae bacterium]
MRRGWLVALWAVVGTIVGQLVGTALAPQVPMLEKSLSLGFDPTQVNLGFMLITLGIQLKLSLAGALGLVVALWLALRNS